MVTIDVKFPKLSEEAKSDLDALLEWFEKEARREELYRRLRRWHFPDRLARFLAQRCPERWLPEPEA